MGAYHKHHMINFDDLPKPTTLVELALTGVLLWAAYVFEGLHYANVLVHVLAKVFTYLCYFCGAISAISSFYPPFKTWIVKVIDCSVNWIKSLVS